MSERQAANNRAQPIPAAPIAENPTTDVLNMPTGTPIALMLDVLSYGENIGELQERKEAITPNSKIEVKVNGDTQVLTQTNKDGTAQITIEVSDIDKIAKTNKAAKKLFFRILNTLNQNPNDHGKVVMNASKPYVEWALSTMVEDGNYSDTKNARRGFKLGSSGLASFQIKGKVTKGSYQKKKDGETILEEIDAREATEADALVLPFTAFVVTKGTCRVYLNPLINWSFFTQYFTILPPYFYRLNNKSIDLLFYIFSQARQNADKIKKNGCFYISFRAIQYKLSLPDENKAANPSDSIKKVIEKVITEIEENQSADVNSDCLKLTPEYPPSASISQYLDMGKLRVDLSGEYAEYFINLSKRKSNTLSEASKKKEKKEQRKEDAIAKQIGNRLADEYLKNNNAEDQTESETA